MTETSPVIPDDPREAEPPRASADTPLPAPRRSFTLSERRLLLVVGDALFVATALLIAFHLRSASIRGQGFAIPRVAVMMAILTWIVSAELVDAYRLRNTVDVRTSFRIVLSALSLSSVVLLALFFVFPFRITRPTLLLWIPIAGVLLLAWRTGYQRLFSRAIFAGNLVVLASHATFDRLWREAEETLPNLYRVVDVFDPGDPLLVSRLAAVTGADVVVETRRNVPAALFAELLRCHDRGIRVRSLADLYEEMTGRLPIELLDLPWLTSLEMRSETSRVYSMFRRALDIVAGAAGLVALAAALPIVGAAIWIEDRGPIFFRQTRVGKYGREFEIVKLRTMRADPSSDSRQTGIGDPRVTWVGGFLRRTHLDELPQALNILRGEMSLIGPRPEQPSYVRQMRGQIEFYSARLSVPPGLTGWAQVNYGYGDGVEGARRKLSYDLYSIEHQGFGLDALILARTLRAVLSFGGR